jgi:hypothetical protein
MARRSLGELEKTYKVKAESTWSFFAFLLALVPLSAGCTIGSFFWTESWGVWVCLGVLTLLVGVMALLSLYANLMLPKVERRLRVHENGFIQENYLDDIKEEVFYDDIAAINYQSTGLLAGLNVRTYQNKTIKIWYTVEENHRIYAGLCKATQKRLVEEAEEALADGENVKFGPDLEINDDLLVFFFEKMPWDEVKKIEIWDVYTRRGAALKSRELRFFFRGGWFERTVSRDAMENLHVFLELAAKRYGVQCIGDASKG